MNSCHSWSCIENGRNHIIQLMHYVMSSNVLTLIIEILELTVLLSFVFIKRPSCIYALAHILVTFA